MHKNELYEQTSPHAPQQISPRAPLMTVGNGARGTRGEVCCGNGVRMDGSDGLLRRPHFVSIGWSHPKFPERCGP